MPKSSKRAKAVKKRSLISELMSGVQAMRAHREGGLTLRSHRVERISVPARREK